MPSNAHFFLRLERLPPLPKCSTIFHLPVKLLPNVSPGSIALPEYLTSSASSYTLHGFLFSVFDEEIDEGEDEVWEESYLLGGRRISKKMGKQKQRRHVNGPWPLRLLLFGFVFDTGQRKGHQEWDVIPRMPPTTNSKWALDSPEHGEREVKWMLVTSGDFIVESSRRRAAREQNRYRLNSQLGETGRQLALGERNQFYWFSISFVSRWQVS